MNLKVGITGGIGTGKTVGCKIFELLGVPVYYADQRAKYLMQKDKDVKEKIIKTFGKESYWSNGKLNRSYLAREVFSDKQKTLKINSIVHPAVGKDLMGWFEKTNASYGLYEAALMFESGSTQFLDKIIVVSAPLELRITRVIERDKISRKEVMKRISKQMPQIEKEQLADEIIVNDESKSLISQVITIHHKLLNYAFVSGEED